MSLLAQVVVCTGGACSPVCGGPPVDALKRRWKASQLYGRVHLTFTGCLGRCDRPAQVLISSRDGSRWFSAIDDPSWWDTLSVWAESCSAGGRLLPMPPELNQYSQPWSSHES